MTGISDAAARAARLSRIPGVTLAEAARRYGLSESEVQEARKVTPRLSPAELALAALTRNGTQDAGELGKMDAESRKLLESLSGDIEIKGRHYRLRRPWP